MAREERSECVVGSAKEMDGRIRVCDRNAPLTQFITTYRQ